MGNYFMLFLVLAFVAVALLIEGLYLAWSTTRSPEARRIDARLRGLAAGGKTDAETSILKQRMLDGTPAMQRLMHAVPRLRLLDRLLEQSGLSLSLARLLGYSLGGAAAVALLLLLSPLPAIASVGIGAVAGLLPLLYVKHRQRQRLQRIDRQLPDALDLICRALRAGHAFSVGMQMAGDEMPDPIGAEFRATHEEVSFGVSLQQALANLAARVPSTDVRYFVIAVMIQRESGGNLTEVLGNLAALIRERFKLFEKVRVLAAEGKLSAWILSLLPFGVAGAINLINPGFMAVLWQDPMGVKMVGGALGAMALGIFWMRQIIRIHV